MLIITTGQVYEKKLWEAKGYTAIDVTVKSAKGATRKLAPTWDMVMGYKRGTMSEEEYTNRYRAILSRSKQEDRARWERTIKNHKKIVFLCYCPTYSFCHRHMLAKAFADFATDMGYEVFLMPEHPENTNQPCKPTPPKREVIDSFRGEYCWLSNFFPCNIEYEGQLYSTTEHAFQAAKTTHRHERQWIAGCSTPGLAKTKGRAVRLREDWEQVKDRVMFDICTLKFNIPELREKLLATGNAELVEGNTWGDRYWGVCDGRGQNRLGKILMAIRAHLKEEL